METACAILPSCSQCEADSESASIMSSSTSPAIGGASSTVTSHSTLASPSAAPACWRESTAALARSITAGSGAFQTTVVRHVLELEGAELAGSGCRSSGMVDRRTLLW